MKLSKTAQNAGILTCLVLLVALGVAMKYLSEDGAPARLYGQVSSWTPPINAKVEEGVPAVAPKPKTPSDASRESSFYPLTGVQFERLARWQRERGGMNDVRLAPDGSIYGGETFSGYTSADDRSMAAMAGQGDPHAAAILGERLIERYWDGRNIDDLTEAKRLLLDATMRGFTTSLVDLLELQLDLARQRGVVSRSDKPLVDTDALMEAFQYFYLLERRGDPAMYIHESNIQAVTAASRVGNPKGGALSAKEEAEARKRASALYLSMNDQRNALGLPPFVDGVPPEIQADHDKLFPPNTTTIEPLKR